MEEKKNNKGLVWLIVILIVLILGLVGYIVYDKVLKVDNIVLNNDEKTKTSTTTTTSIKENVNEKISLNNYPKMNDENVIVYGDIFDLAKKYLNAEDFKSFESSSTRFENLDINIDNIRIILSCNNFDEDNQVCYEKNINIDNKLNINFEDYVDYSGVYFLITDKYYVVQYGNGVTQYGSVYVYDKNGNELIKTEATTKYASKSNGEKPAIVFENKLYFIKHVNCYNTLSYIDFNSQNLNVVELDRESTEEVNEC